MDWRSIQFDWNHARAFLVTAEEGSFSAAARILGTTQPTLGRQVAALEKELDLILFDRIGKTLALTQIGIELVDYVREMSDAASKLSITASGQSHKLDGEVSISAIDSIAALWLPPIIKKLRVMYPSIKITVIASNQVSNLIQREADIAIRHVESTQQDLITKRVCNAAARLYGATNYLDALGRPLTIDKLNKADFAGSNRKADKKEFLLKYGLTITEENFSLVSENHLVQWENVKFGITLGMMMEVIGDKEPLVERVMQDSEFILIPIWLVAHKQLRTSKRIRAVYDVLSDSLAELAVFK
jgi:DNA-binding transcriptional LysR family regulator